MKNKIDFLSKSLKKKLEPKAKRIKEVITYKQLLVSLCLIVFSTTSVNAQKGFFVKFSLGPGYTTEYSNINNSAFSIATKNHAIGWGFSPNFALQIGDFGGLNKYKVGDYNYINLDVFGLGFSYRTPIDLKISVMGGYGVVSLAKDWSESMGDNDGKGYGFNISLDKEWFIAKSWGIRVGPQIFWLKTTKKNYEFLNVSLNVGIVFYLTSVE